MKLLGITAKDVSSDAMSNLRTEDLTPPQNHGPNEAEGPNGKRRYALGTENSREETLKRMRTLPERAERLREIIRALREADTR